MTTRRDFIRRGALWVAGAALVEPVARKLWAFPTNPLVANTTQRLGHGDMWDLHLTYGDFIHGERVALLSNGDIIAHGVVRDAQNRRLTVDWA